MLFVFLVLPHVFIPDPNLTNQSAVNQSCDQHLGAVNTNYFELQWMASLPSEKLSQLRQAIHGHVSDGNIQEKIRACLTEALAQEGGR